MSKIKPLELFDQRDGARFGDLVQFHLIDRPSYSGFYIGFSKDQLCFSFACDQSAKTPDFEVHKSHKNIRLRGYRVKGYEIIRRANKK